LIEALFKQTFVQLWLSTQFKLIKCIFMHIVKNAELTIQRQLGVILWCQTMVEDLFS